MAHHALRCHVPCADRWKRLTFVFQLGYQNISPVSTEAPLSLLSGGGEGLFIYLFSYLVTFGFSFIKTWGRLVSLVAWESSRGTWKFTLTLTGVTDLEEEGGR